MISFGILSAAFGLKGFLLPNHFLDGGITGTSIIVNELTQWNLSILLVLINLPFIILAWFQNNRSLALKSVICIALFALIIHLFDDFSVTQDKLLISVFGGFFLGLGIGLAMRGGAVLDGTEVLALFLSKKTGLSVGDVILAANIIIFGSAAYLLSTEKALYGILTYLIAARTVDFTLTGVEEYIGVTIISPKSDEIRKMITGFLGRGVTIYSGKGGYANEESQLDSYEILYSIVTRLEIRKLQNAIHKVDPKAFVIMHSIKDIRGGMVKRRAFDH